MSRPIRPPNKTRDDVSGLTPWRRKLHEIIFEADTFAGRTFDIALFILIGMSVLVVMMESVVRSDHATGPPAFWVAWLKPTEWVLTIISTIEYVLRIVSVRQPARYIFSFYGLVDLLSILPTYASLYIDRTRFLTVIRTLRLLRVFRVLKLAQYLAEAETLLHAFRQSRAKITVFFLMVMILVLILGSVMYVIEGGGVNEQFSSLPKSVYWAIVTVTTVGYGDIAPVTPPGQAVASLAMILGYSIIVVPTGFTLAEVMTHSSISTQSCPNCVREGHAADAIYCKYCGAKL
ncbi:MAG: ion transporter [Planctomycetales bacterium]|nr:ion transporter [Planctomycetales bacterium]